VIDISGNSCVFHGAAGPTTAVWAEPPVSDENGFLNFFDVAFYGTAGEGVEELGRGVAGSAVICDDVAYWLTDGTNGDEVRRWAPGGDIEVIYRSPDEGRGRRYSTSKPICGEGFIAIQRAGWTPGAPDEILTNRPLEWNPTLPLWTPPTPDVSGYLAALMNHPDLTDWVAEHSDATDLGALACSELDNVTEGDRVAYIYDDATEEAWMQRAGFSDPTQLWYWRQITTQYLCPRYYQLTVGD
jgi:hypothetical protein